MRMLGGKGALVLAVALGSITSFLAWQYVQQAGQGAAPAVVETTPVVVAAASIPARAVVSPDMVRVQAIPVEARHPSAFRSPAEVVGKVSRSALTPGEQVLTTKLYLQREESGLAFMVPEGMRAVSVGFNEVIGTGGMVLPGDHVDVIGVFEVKPPLALSVVASSGNRALFQRDGGAQPDAQAPARDGAGDQTVHVATVVLQDVEVLAVAQRLEGEDTRDTQTRLVAPVSPGGSATNPSQQARSQPAVQPGAKTATFAVSPEDALRLILAEDRGKIRLALRRSRDDAVASVAALPFDTLVQSSVGAAVAASPASGAR